MELDAQTHRSRPLMSLSSYYIVLHLFRESFGGSHCSIITNLLDSNNILIVYELRLHYSFHFQINTHWKGMSSLIARTMGQLAPLMFFYNDTLGFKLPWKVDIPLTKKTNLELFIKNLFIHHDDSRRRKEESATRWCCIPSVEVPVV